METVPGKSPGAFNPRAKSRSTLARKYSVFTAILLTWVSLIFFFYDLQRDSFAVGKALFLIFVVAMMAVAVSRFTHSMLARPLIQLEKGIQAVREGRLDPVQVSRTGDEIEYLGENLNAMIAALAASRNELRRHQELLEERILQRTEALEEATQRALAANRAKSEFLANISHELRTPMNGVLGMIDIVLDEQLNAEHREHLETARRCAVTLLALLNDLLDISKIEAGRVILEKVPCDLRATAEDCLKALVPQAREKGIVLTCSVSPRIPRVIIGDPLRLRQILINLLGNAVKFTAGGKVGLHIDMRGGAQDSELLIEVADTGCGIPADKLASIFEQFTQADGSITRKYGGTGLGLTITRRLVELHEGSIGVESEVGNGSRFLVRLPCLRAPEVEQEAAPAAAGGSPAAALPRSASRGRILVVEDNLVNQKVVKTILTKRGYEVRTAANGRLAVEMMERESFDLILMDIQMPEMNGLDAARILRGMPQGRHVPIVAMTAHAMDGDRSRCLEAGMDGYISKPVASDRLLEVVREFMSKRSPEAPPEDAGGAHLPPPIDATQASRLMDKHTDLMRGMALLFLQLAPERIQKLHVAAIRSDAPMMSQHAGKLEKAAERIAALEVARCARELEEAAAAGDAQRVPKCLAALEGEIRRLDQHVRLDGNLEKHKLTA